MILLIISTLIFLALLALFFLSNPKKILILSVCVILLVICNFINEIQAAYEEDAFRYETLPDNHKHKIEHLEAYQWLTLNNDTAYSHSQ